jgi:hypothetical protein
MTFDTIVEWIKVACPTDFKGDTLVVETDDPLPLPPSVGKHRVVISRRPPGLDGCEAGVAELYNATTPGGLMVMAYNPNEELKTHHRATIDDAFFDYMIYENGVFVGRKPSISAAFLPTCPTVPLLLKRPDRNLIYVLCPTSEALEKARDVYANCKWARLVFNASTYYLENVAYHFILPSRALEWEHADFVGCIGWRAYEKMTSLDINHVIREGNKADVIAFLFRGDLMVKTADTWHPKFSKIWTPLLESMGYKKHDIESDDIPAFYCNYWAARPAWMAEYIGFSSKLKRAMETVPTIQADLWSDSTYMARGKDIAKMSEEQCMTVWGVPFYPYHTFICERAACFFFWIRRAKLAGVR